MLTCLIYLLGGTDYHRDNIIAHSDYPVLIDTETLVYPSTGAESEEEDNDQATILIRDLLRNSVLSSGFLPFLCEGIDMKAIDISGLGGIENQETGRPYIRWKYINTDQMHIVYINRKTLPGINIPELNGKGLKAQNYVKEIIGGFERLYDFLVKKRDKLLAANSPLMNFKNRSVRFIIRATQIYKSFLERLTHPEFLSNEIDRSTQLEYLSRVFLSPSPSPHNRSIKSDWSVYKAEVDALEGLDIPFFMSNTSQKSLITQKGVIVKDYFKDSGINGLFSRLKKLDENDKQQQIAYIKAAFQIRYKTNVNRVHKKKNTAGQDFMEYEPVSVEKLIEESRVIAREIEHHAWYGEDQSASWITIGSDPIVGSQRIEPMDLTFYNGICGVVFFLAAFEQVTGCDDFHHLALRALLSLKKRWSNLKRSLLANHINIGGIGGIGSLLYCLTFIGKFLKEEELIERGKYIIDELITAKEIEKDLYLDIISGSAGAILALLAYADVTGNKNALDRAVFCGKHLINQQVTVPFGHRAWKTMIGSQPLTGFAHGASGIAYALLRLYKASNNREFLKAACDGMEYENSIYSQKFKNWPDLRENIFPGQNSKKKRFMTAWCHGAPGIGLARAAGLEILFNPGIRETIKNAVETTMAYPLEGMDHLCCGNFGRIDVQLEVANRLNLPGLLDIAKRKTTWIIKRKERAGHYCLNGAAANAISNPSFFQGTSGIGYQLLRLAFPGSLPCVLLLDWQAGGKNAGNKN